MPAPTALQRAPETLGLERPQDVPISASNDGDLEDIEIDTSTPAQLTSFAPSTPTQPTDTTMQIADEEGRPQYPATTPTNTASPTTTALKTQSRKVPVPPHRMTPLKNSWPKIYPPLVEHLKLQVRMNIKSRAVELRTSRYTTSPSALQSGEDFIRAFTLGFDVDDAIALLRLDDLYIETFEIKDVKTLQGEHLSRAIGRIAGKDGKTKFAIENTTKTRVVLADSKIHILGGFRNIRIAREAVVSLILGAPPGKVYGNLRIVAGRMKERF
ncbi:Pre-rRNA-processing protein PNO1 [Cyphellophora attinorum]|uniref:Pre-rRNA-processing protein PNO1 n=1 Tax=Cyphellophora attinorum TaxID=1664694 RepID=A0A0N0NS30_9EURO|nr:Pre-rRNA-processing protein PNO1 [Phialophora attinorum]KPI45781.1 Pre-rRNA-processing protein PNO1 [Phialophora attinorum]